MKKQGDKYYVPVMTILAIIFLCISIFIIKESYSVSNKPKILMLCSQPGQGCVPYTEPKEINHIIRQSYLEE